MHKNQIITGGLTLAQADKALILIHGRGGSARDILSLSEHLDVSDFALLAPQASGNSWYSYSFLAPRTQNEPGLSSGLALIRELVAEITATIPLKQIYFSGFSQGACLMLDFLARNPGRYGGAAAFSGGLIGDQIDRNDYSGDFQAMPFFIGSSDPDSHIPVPRVRETTSILQGMKGKVTERIYPGMGHTIIKEETELANDLIFRQA